MTGGIASGPDHLLAKVIDRWRRTSLANQFAITASLVIVVAMTALGTWTAARIEESVLRNSAGSAALYMDSFIEPHITELKEGERLDPVASSAIDRLLAGQLGERVLAIKIWGPGGYIIYSSNKQQVAERYPVTERLKSAWAGKIEAEFDDLHDDENMLERRLGAPLVEIYSPIRKRSTGRVIAVAEFYELADALAKDLKWARLHTALAVGSLALLMALSVSGIVRRGSRTIEQQSHALEQRVDDLSRLLRQNDELKARTIDASRRAADTNESVLRRVGAELHDGPTQLIGLALLRLDGLTALAASTSNPRDEENAHIIKRALDDAMNEIRHLCAGLALPELAPMKVSEVIELAIRNHERRSLTRVEAAITPELKCSASPVIKMTAYRFVQEGLNNAYRHAGARGQGVRAACSNGELVIEVRDRGDGFDPSSKFVDAGSLGLKGLRDRIEAVGGVFDLKSENGHGTRLVARLPSNVESSPHG